MDAHHYIDNIADALPDIPPDGILSRTFLKTGHCNGILFGFAAGEELSEHTASRPAILHILEGEATLTLGEETHSASAGAWAYMPPHLPHSILAHNPVKMLLLLL